ncbi:hypothetical protein GCM10010517_62070 [Streptosporangium fragile]|uniref:Uncharacterized protein n=1 Tax=Streptosporangium fragile TaxID=46186 RepID=A0ABN3W773_9ACTN
MVRPDRPGFWVAVAGLALLAGLIGPLAGIIPFVIGLAAMFAAVVTAYQEAARLRAQQSTSPAEGDPPGPPRTGGGTESRS